MSLQGILDSREDQASAHVWVLGLLLGQKRFGILGSIYYLIYFLMAPGKMFPHFSTDTRVQLFAISVKEHQVLPTQALKLFYYFFVTLTCWK